MGKNRPSNEDAPRVPGSEGGPPWGRIIAALIGLLFLALLIPLACQALRGDGGSEARDSGAQENANTQGKNREQGDAGAAAGGARETTDDATVRESAQGKGATGGGSSSSEGSGGATAAEQDREGENGVVADEQQGGARDEKLPESGGIPASSLPALGAAMILVGTALLGGFGTTRG